MHGDLNDERAAGGLVVFDPDASSVRLDGDAAERQAEALAERGGIALRPRNADVLVEDPRELVGRNPDPVVLDRDLDHARPVRRG